jgi:hypothetical protein
MRKVMAVLAFTLAACGGSGDKAGGAGASDFATTCAGIFSIEASLAKSCSKVNPAFFTPPGSFDLSRICPFIESEITSGRVHHDANQWAACLDAYRAVTCADLPPGSISGSPAIQPAACAAALTGTVAVAGPCVTGLDCANGFCSSDYALTCPGTCQPFLAAGGNCALGSCGPGLACATAAVTRSCKATGAAGAACPCQAGLWCNTANAGGRCEPPIAAGGACAAFSPGCPAGYRCQGATSIATGTCQPQVGPGGACAVPDQCSLGYRCVSGTCASWAGLGQDCTNSGCLAGYCDSATGLCTPFLADGASCTTTGPACLSGSCNTATLKCERSLCRP